MRHYLLLGALASALSMAACKAPTPPKEEAKKFELSDTMARMVKTDTVGFCNIDDAITLSGEVSFNDNAVVKVFARTSGQVLESKVTLGDKVQAGQVLAVIKSADVAGGYADLSGADADIAIAKRQLDNTQSLYQSGIASEKDYTDAQQNYQKALAAKRKIEAVLNINSGGSTKPGGTYVITAPISGYIVEKKVNAGSFIRSDASDNMFTISSLQDVWVWANVFETDIPKVKEGVNVQVTTLAYPDKIFQGKIDKMSEVLDPSNKALRVRISLKNDGLLLKPEMFAKVIVSNLEATKALCIPTRALISQNGKDYVVIYGSKSDMKIAEVDIIKTVGDKTYVNTGALNQGQQVITQNQLLVFEQLLKS
ncbi:efflux RND transporter periplasmic adaptor subunit [Deminuibacter soli]|uniref:Efflux RND transporter periplasmic adaptor subunit n=1 Tax=Deminuibacter soli TaxID=2291815 RepID=A0A3E1NK77_9BACT|nr:efflux RND transporter periplasmic adaptor subunit [Deminuibacter soli]RFM28337.1 efflux RND transporter periplasmic adaptor subunit [Deminuibacter soli]